MPSLVGSEMCIRDRYMGKQQNNEPVVPSNIQPLTSNSKMNTNTDCKDCKAGKDCKDCTDDCKDCNTCTDCNDGCNDCSKDCKDASKDCACPETCHAKECKCDKCTCSDSKACKETCSDCKDCCNQMFLSLKILVAFSLQALSSR
eukprot:TRINITY_DN455_c0_g1_i3.p2 TRINITY_DN455_c0_g1~~TRINITY_DN455_c0_g1_i3.p2  ORF type:complete len:145 (-),score=41.64 TRINITY_DN455_c0_g1_i3:69-503(-)